MIHLRHVFLCFDSYNLTWDIEMQFKVKISCESDDFDSRKNDQRIYLPCLSTMFRLPRFISLQQATPSSWDDVTDLISFSRLDSDEVMARLHFSFWSLVYSS